MTVGGGALWSHVLERVDPEFGAPGGFDPRVGVAGLTLGGGYGILTRLHGLSADNLISLNVVTASGARLTTSAEEEPELFWAMRGAGPNFAAVLAAPARAAAVRARLLSAAAPARAASAVPRLRRRAAAARDALHGVRHVAR